MHYRLNISSGEGAQWVDIDERQVYCPRSSLIGYSRTKARPGDLILWSETCHPIGEPDKTFQSTGQGRVVGRISSGDHRGKILVLQVFNGLRFASFCIVPPEDVTEIRDWPTNFLAWLAEDLPRPNILAEMHRYGSLSDSYIEGGEERARERFEKGRAWQG